MSHNEDLRIKRTRKLLRDALIEATTEKGFAAVTVQDITDRAMVNRATFYRHYQDKYDLALANVKDLLTDLHFTDQPLDIQSKVDLTDQAVPVLVQLFEHIRDHAAFYRIILGKEGSSTLEAPIRSYVEQVMRRRLELAGYDPQRARMPLELCINVMVSTALGLVKWWLEHDLPYSPEQMATWLPQINVRGLQYALGFEPKDEGGRMQIGPLHPSAFILLIMLLVL